jgi:hypothetical protein
MWVDLRNRPNRKHTINKRICGPGKGGIVCEQTSKETTDRQKGEMKEIQKAD